MVLRDLKIGLIRIHTLLLPLFTMVPIILLEFSQTRILESQLWHFTFFIAVKSKTTSLRLRCEEKFNDSIIIHWLLLKDLLWPDTRKLYNSLFEYYNYQVIWSSTLKFYCYHYSQAKTVGGTKSRYFPFLYLCTEGTHCKSVFHQDTVTAYRKF